MWAIIRGWLDPVVAGKIHFTKTVEELSAFVPRSNIIKELGGDEDWEYHYIEPHPEENAQMADTAARDKILTSRADLVTRYETATREWVRAGENAKEVGEDRFRMAADLRKNYWTLDPYVRARTLYDRLGMLRRGGDLDFYPAATALRPAAQDSSTNDLD